MNYNVDDDEDDSDANTSFDGKKSLASIFDGDHNFECFEDAEADSYYSEEEDEEETSHYDDDDDYEDEYDDRRYASQPPQQQHYNHKKASSSAPEFKLVSSVPSDGPPPSKQQQQKQKQPKKQQKQKPPPQPLQQKLQQQQHLQQQQQQQNRRRSSGQHQKHPLPPTRLQARPNAPNHFAAFVDHGDWRVMGKDANKIRRAAPMHRQQRMMDGDSSSDDSDDDSSDSCSSNGRRRRRNNNNSSSSADWEPEHSSSHDGALDNFSDEETVMEQPKSPKKDKDDEDRKRELRSRMPIFEQRRWEAFRPRVQMLIMEVMPENADQIDDLLLQFTGREEELIQTLENRRGRACRSRTNKAVVHRSRQIKATRHAQEYQTTEALAHIAAACTIDEGVNIKPEFWKDDATSVYTQDLDDTEDKGSYYSEEDETSSYYSRSSKEEEEVSGSEGSSFYTDSSSEEEDSASEDDYSEEQTEGNSFSYEENDNWGFDEAQPSGYQI